MTDHDALLNAIIAEPDDDPARLVYADLIEDAGEPERAAFVRDQVELARTPDWEPFAVRYRRDDVPTQAGDRFRPSLPWADGWNPRFPFRRGLGYSIKTTSVGHLVEVGDDLFASAPIGELHLPGGDMSEYEEFARQPWLSRVESLRFWGGRTPTEAVRVLCGSPLPTRLRSLHFERATSPGMYALVENVFRSPLGRQLRELSFRMGDGSQLDLIEALEVGETPRLERLTFDNMGMDSLAAERLIRSAVLPEIHDLTFRQMFLTGEQLGGILRKTPALESLTLRGMNFRSRTGGPRFFGGLASLARLRNLKRLDLTGSYPLRHSVGDVAAKSLKTVRSLGLGSLNLGSPEVDESILPKLMAAPCWPNLVEIDLSSNGLSDRSVAALLAASRPHELVTLDLSDNPSVGPHTRAMLMEHFGEAVLLD